MRCTLALLLLGLPLLYVFLLRHIHSQDDNPVLSRRQNTDDQIIASYAQQGLCLSYLETIDHDKSVAPCKPWCLKQNSTDYGV